MIMRAEEECLSHNRMNKLLQELMRYCDAMDCVGITSVLNTAVSGFGDHRVRYDHLWKNRVPCCCSRAAAAPAAGQRQGTVPRQTLSRPVHHRPKPTLTRNPMTHFDVLMVMQTAFAH